MSAPPDYAVEHALNVLAAAARAERLPVSAYGDIARLRMEYRVSTAERPATPEDVAFHGFMAAAFPWIGPPGADWRNMREAFLAGRKSITPAEFEGVPV
jgi:hypothetical protein